MKEKKMIPIQRDGNRISKMCADLETFCGLMNDLIAKLRDHGIFAKDFEVTDDISLNIEPSFNAAPPGNAFAMTAPPSVGMGLKLNF